MLEGSKSQPQREIKPLLRSMILYIPLVISTFQTLPCTAVFLARLRETGTRTETCMRHALPFASRHCLTPQSLGLGPYHVIIAEPFQFLAISGIDKFVVFPEYSWTFYHRLYF